MKLSDIDLVTHQYNPPVIVVLKALYVGMEVRLQNWVCKLAKTVDGGEQIIAVSVDQDGTLHAVGFDLTMSDLTRIANRMSHDELTVLSHNYTFNRMRFLDASGRKPASGADH